MLTVSILTATPNFTIPGMSAIKSVSTPLLFPQNLVRSLTRHSIRIDYWSGIAALVPLAWLCWASLTPIRNYSYEFFKWMHIVSAILFSAFFYIHCNNVSLLTSIVISSNEFDLTVSILNSFSRPGMMSLLPLSTACLVTKRYIICRHYIFGAAAVYLTSVVVRFGLLFTRNGRHIAKGHVEALPDNAVRVTISLHRSAGHRWTAGQHFFVNFFKVRALESHPYTISNAPYNDPSSSVCTFEKH